MGKFFSKDGIEPKEESDLESSESSSGFFVPASIVSDEAKRNRLKQQSEKVKRHIDSAANRGSNSFALMIKLEDEIVKDLKASGYTVEVEHLIENMYMSKVSW